jgi:hypothetical protein
MTPTGMLPAARLPSIEEYVMETDQTAVGAIDDQTVVGAIDKNRIYGVEGFHRQSGLGSGALRAARRDGLPVYYCHNRAFIRGEDWYDCLSAQSTNPPGPSQGICPPHLRKNEGEQI